MPPPDAAVAALVERAAEEVDAGRLPSCQLALARDGEVINLVTLGKASDESRYVVFSVTKAVVAAAIWLLIAEGRLAAETRVVDLVPEFGSNGKEAVTLEHLLTHTAGIARAPLRPAEGATREARLRRFAQWRLDWPPGTQTEYSTVSHHWVVAELIERATGSNYREYVNNRVLDALGLARLRLGVPLDEQDDVVEISLLEAAAPPAIELPLASEHGYTLLYNDPAVRAAGVPGAGAIGGAADVALLYQALLHNPDRLFDPAVLADGTSHIRNTLIDPWIRVPANRTLGLGVAGDDGNAMLRQFGRTIGPRAFGASGIGGQIAWADPDTGLSFCYLTNGVEADPIVSFTRADALSTLAGVVAESIR